MKFSIITVCKNSEKTIEKSILSVINQSYQDFEYIIIDGVSTDNTLKIIEKYRNNITKVVSEEDNGLYDAMNKGIRIASGEYLFFLNSDDQLLHENILELVANFADTDGNDSYELLYGDLLVLNKKTGRLSIQKHNKFNKIYLMKNTPCQPATFYKKETFEKYGYFDTDYKIVSDHEWFLRVFLKHSIKAKHLGFPVNIFNMGGISTNSSREEKIIAERNDMFGKYFTKFERIFYEFFSRYLRTITTFPIICRFFN